MPAFGAFTGGLNVRDGAFADVFGTLSFTAHMLGEGRLYAIRRQALPAGLIPPEHRAGDPAGEQRHQRGGQAVEQPVIVRGVSDVLLEAGLDDFQRRSGARDHRRRRRTA